MNDEPIMRNFGDYRNYPYADQPEASLTPRKPARRQRVGLPDAVNPPSMTRHMKRLLDARDAALQPHLEIERMMRELTQSPLGSSRKILDILASENKVRRATSPIPAWAITRCRG